MVTLNPERSERCHQAAYPAIGCVTEATGNLTCTGEKAAPCIDRPIVPTNIIRSPVPAVTPSPLQPHHQAGT